MRIDIGKEVKEIVEEMTMQAIENQEEFIFETIRPYCENVLQIKINKEGLKQILLNNVQKQQPCEDAISREEAIRVAEQGQIQGYEWQFKKLCNLPSVTPQRKTGKWIILDECANEGVYCSECHKKVFKLEFSPTMKWQNFEYCPNCGAKMESEGENDT